METENRAVKFMEHTFIKQVISDHKLLNKENTVYNCKKLFIATVYNKLASIKISLENLMMIRVMVAEFHSATENSSSISRAAILKYHIENYFIRITTCRDLFYQLMTIILKVKVDKHQTVLMNAILKHAKKEGDLWTKNYVHNLQKLFSRVNKNRNIIAHEGVFVSSGTIEEKLHFQDSVDLKEASVDYFNTLVKPEISSITSEMVIIETELATNFFFLADELLKRFLVLNPKEN